MKYAIGIALFCWLLCGAVGAWLQTIAMAPIGKWSPMAGLRSPTR